MASLLCLLPFAASLFQACAALPPTAAGYVEGEYDLVAPVAVARIDALEAHRGEHVAAGAVLARMEKRDAVLTLAQANAALAQARSQLADLKQGRRPEEIAVLAASLQSAKAQADEAQKELARAQSLSDRGVSAQSALDAAQTRVEVARATVAQAAANLAVAKLPARPDQIAAAEAAVAQALAARDAAAWQLDQRVIRAPAAGVVRDILRHPGEIAGPSAPVLSFLPDGAVKLRFYIPETAYSALHVGSRVDVQCDGCGAGETAIVTYMSDSPEFTPPVIYSLQNRQTLSYLVEARPTAEARLLKPGQIVDVVLPEARK